MKKELKTAVLIDKKGKLYKLLYLIFSEDGSIYLTYPRKQGYKIVSNFNVPAPKGKKKKTVEFKRKDSNCCRPKISFHPKEMIIHLETDVNKFFNTDKAILNRGVEALATPLCQVLTPFDIDFLDLYSQKKEYHNPLVIKLSNNQKGTLSLLLWIHDSNYFLPINDLPLIDEIKKISKQIISRKFNHPFLKNFTCSVFIHDLGIKNKQGGSKVNSIITAVYNKESPYVFEIIPKEKNLPK
jgi:hypothetical protein